MWPLLLNLQNKKILKIIDFGVVKRRFENPQRTQSTLPVFLLVCLAKIQFFSKSKEKEGEIENMEIKNIIENQTFDEERALYNLKDTEVKIVRLQEKKMESLF